MDKAKALNYHYDREEDILYVTLGDSDSALCIEQENGFLVRIDPESDEIVGFTVIDFSQRAADRVVTPVYAQFTLPQKELQRLREGREPYTVLEAEDAADQRFYKSKVERTEHPCIVKVEGVVGGEPIIYGTRTSVRAIVEWWKLGASPDEILEHLPHLRLGQIFDALSYYDTHRDEIEYHILRNKVTEVAD
ncbi:MAG: DUF433 domain-containing protein [Anaerolineales bacterium]|nr:MAG: DUF433 domain-containing protein [Anaerolineales bacterium]